MATSISSMTGAENAAPVPSRAFPVQTAQEHARFVGAVTCQSSLCHGGASPLHCQYTIWSHDDAHARAYAALVSDYGANIARAAGITSATTDARCVACHAPLAMPGVTLAPTASVLEGVTCETCHNSAAAWLRSHTRPDYTYADRVQSGLRDLRDVYARADTCVKCHQVIAPDLIKAGHPALVFELDGQAASEPRHWMEKESWFGAKAWLVGQLVALRDLCEQLGKTNQGVERNELQTQMNALLGIVFSIPSVNGPGPNANLAEIAAWADYMARKISDEEWTDARTRDALEALAGLSDTFRPNYTSKTYMSQADKVARAQRLVLGLDRLLKATQPLPPSDPMKPPALPSPLPGESELTVLFNEVQDPANFDPKKFADSLQKFAAVVAPAKN